MLIVITLFFAILFGRNNDLHPGICSRFNQFVGIIAAIREQSIRNKPFD